MFTRDFYARQRHKAVNVKQSKYESKPVDELGRVAWSAQENDVWRQLVTRQLACIKDKACQEYLDGLRMLDLPHDTVPQIPDVNAVLMRETGWQVAPVPALIDFDQFFALLADKKFPAATFLRTKDDFDYLQEPDYFHEIFGHCAMLTHPAFAEFTHMYGQLGKKATPKERVYLARLYWFTVEFGLLSDSQDNRSIYGGGILSSPAETEYAFNSDKAVRKPLEVIDVMRTPYRIDIMQPIYFTIESIDDLFAISQRDLIADVHQAMELGLHAPLFPPKPKKTEQQKETQHV
ncbi:phenylalanine 4-monooxygenase [Salinivibrio sp. YCSC6]|uniref:phenylalanine 4-monooxygenase n=1 Tax=Salinivibrio sp. YCSC6 TaxID=2003370 RepID=UPI000BBC91DE|nr:phenylalanine 4-monooxygenase [Salinivibrio sp. YCSC6]PCE65563.1 phenylalanine 4-monooxygenase [Salinivibrio sp. YCSC6]QCF37404.1 phenylalanine 4-monooxygenase [Salinivibrio sp. YCSC6]